MLRARLNLRERLSAPALSLVCLIAWAAGGWSQTPVLLPNTMTTIAGGAPVATTAGAACPTNPQYTATDAVGNGCPAANATLSGTERGVAVDPQGNVYLVNDSSNQGLRKIDARTGNISFFAGANVNGGQCGNPVTVNGRTYTQVDKLGDGCPVSFSGGFNATRGLGADPYGNVLFTGQGDNIVHLICLATSPACTAAQATDNVMLSVSGCTVSTSNYGTAVNGTTAGSAGDGGPATQLSGTCTTGNNQPLSVTADKWDNIYFIDAQNVRYRVVLGAPTATFNGATSTNPLYAVLKTSTTSPNNYSNPIQGYVYPIAGGGTACAANTDAGGDGCPFYNTVLAGSTSKNTGLAVSNDGDFLFTDGNGRLRVIYMGGAAIKAVLATNGVATPQIGFSYGLVFASSNQLFYNTAAPGVVAGSNRLLQNAIQLLAVDPAGNILIGDQAQVLFYDIATGYLRRLGGGTNSGAGTTSCNANTLGDGCPIAQSLFGGANSKLPIAIDNLGNLYIQDPNNKLIRRASTATLPTTALNGSLLSPLVVHAPAANSTVSVTAAPSTDFTLGATACAAKNADNTVDCTANITYAPKLLATRANALTISTTAGTTTTTQAALVGANSTGTGLAFDVQGTPATAVLGAAATGNTQVVLDGAGSAYVIGTQGISKINLATSAITVISPTAPGYFAADPQGNVYGANAASASITKYTLSASGTYAASTVAIPAVPLNGTLTQINGGPLTVDLNGEIYVADLTSKQLVKFSQTSGSGQQLTQTALANPSAIAQDSYGNLLVIDGASVLRIPAAGLPVTSASPVANPVVSFSPALTAPTAVSADQGGNLYVADTSVVVRSFGGAQYRVPASATTSLSARGLAVGGGGNLYLVSPAIAGVTQVLRNAQTHDFGTDITTPYAGVLINTGATASTGFNATDTAGNYTFAAPASPLAPSAATCVIASTALAGGGLCNTSITFSPTAVGNGPAPDVITLLPAANTLGTLSLTGTKTGMNATTSTSITGSTTGLVYSPGTETTFTVTVMQSPGAPAGSVAVTIDGSAAVNYNLVSMGANTATAAVPIMGLNAAPHTILASYASSSGITGSTSSTVSFTIAQAATTISWAPSTTTQQYSTAIGAAVLDAVASNGGTTVPGTYVYTATPSGGTAAAIDSASYLPAITTYTLAVTFTPSAAYASNYTGSTATLSSTFTVTKASTTAAVGGSTMIVAPAGGSFTSLEAAIKALPATGGNVYLAPGTYKEQVLVNIPNVQLHGLGGNAQAVTLTAENGAYTTTPQPTYGILTNPFGFNNDEGSATLVVAPSGTTPSNFYMDYLSVANTYDLDNTNTNANFGTASNACSSTTTSSNFSLYNAGTLCGSQAIAFYITADKSVINNVRFTSLQDTIATFNTKNNYPSCSAGSTCASRQYYWRNYITGDVDYVFGDSAAVFDQSNFYTTYHGVGPAGQANIFAQSKGTAPGSSSDYLSGFVVNNSSFTSEMDAGPLTQFYFGRPLVTAYSTVALLNNTVDDINAAGWTSGNNTNLLNTMNWFEYNTTCTTANCTTTGRETQTAQPEMQPLAAIIPYAPTNFLSAQYNANNIAIAPDSWNPTAALTTGINGYVPVGATATINYGQSIAILAKPQVPGGGTIPTGSYTLTDNGTSLVGTGTLTGQLDASGAAYLLTSSLSVGTHNLVFTYNGDSKFSGSASSAYVVTVNGIGTSTTLSTMPGSPVYGQTVSLSATVSPASGATPTGTATLSVDSGATTSTTLVNGVATFSLSGLSAATHTVQVVYQGAGANTTSTGTGTITVARAVLTVTAANVSRPYQTPKPAFTYSVSGFQYSETSTAFSGAPSLTTTAVPNSPAGTYPVTASIGSLSAANYSFAFVSGTLTVQGGAPQAIVFGKVPNLPVGINAPLFARALSGLPVTYTVTGPATISGNHLIVTGSGNITVTANQAGNATFAAATSVSRSFTAQ